MHACDLASALSLSRVMVPPAPGALSAFGILSSDVVKDYSRTAPMIIVLEHLDGLNKEIEAGFKKLTQAATREYAKEGWKGKVKLERSVDVRYQGQGYELNIPWHNASALAKDFHATHQRRFGYHHHDKKIELVTLRVRASLPQPSGTLAGARFKQNAKVDRTRAKVYFDQSPVMTSVLRRESLSPGFSASGPLIVTEYTATTVVPPGWQLKVDRSGALLISRRGARMRPTR